MWKIYAGKVRLEEIKLGSISTRQYKKEKDIFLDMQLRIGCDYISELPFKKKEVWNAMGEMDLSDYRQEQLEDFSIYIFGVSYPVLQNALEDFHGGRISHFQNIYTFYRAALRLWLKD